MPAHLPEPPEGRHEAKTELDPFVVPRVGLGTARARSARGALVVATSVDRGPQVPLLELEAVEELLLLRTEEPRRQLLGQRGVRLRVSELDLHPVAALLELPAGV